MNRQIQVTEDTRPINMPTSLPYHKGDTNKILLRAAWKAAEVSPTYPIDTRTAFALLRIMGFDATRQTLDYHFARGYLKPPKKVNKAFQWEEKNVVAFADSLESTRNFLPMHPCHIHKLTPRELARHQIEFARCRNAVATFDSMEPNELINVLANSDSASDRTLIAAVLKKKLSMLHVRGTETAPDPTAAALAEAN